MEIEKEIEIYLVESTWNLVRDSIPDEKKCKVAKFVYDNFFESDDLIDKNDFLYKDINR